MSLNKHGKAAKKRKFLYELSAVISEYRKNKGTECKLRLGETREPVCGAYVEEQAETQEQVTTIWVRNYGYNMLLDREEPELNT